MGVCQIAQWITDNGYIMNAKGAVDTLSTYLPETEAATLAYILNNMPEDYSVVWNSIYNSAIVPATEEGTTQVGNIVKGITTPEESAANMQRSADDYMKSK